MRPWLVQPTILRMCEYLIVGGGLIGLFTARYLSQAGAQVSLVERGQVGQESSWAGGGILSPLYPWQYPVSVNKLADWSQQHYRQLANELQENTGMDVEWIQSGLLILDNEQTRDALDWAQQMDAKVLSVSGKEISEIESAVGERQQAGLWLPDVAQIRTPKLIQALRKDLGLRGVDLIQNTEVTGFKLKDRRITGVYTAKGEIDAANVVLACGAWSAILLKVLDENFPVEPVRGQMILLKTKADQLRRIVLHRGYYAIPRRDGRVLVGSTMEYVGFDKQITSTACDELVRAAREMLPALAEAPLEKQWAGLRPGSPEGVPYIGPYPQMEGLFVNTGHFRNGVVTAPASSKLLVDILLGNKSLFETDSYRVSRAII